MLGVLWHYPQGAVRSGATRARGAPEEQGGNIARAFRNVEMAEKGDRAVVHGAIFPSDPSREYVRVGAA